MTSLSKKKYLKVLLSSSCPGGLLMKGGEWVYV